MTENKAVGKITLLTHTRGRKKKKNNFSTCLLNLSLTLFIQYIFTEELLYARCGGYKSSWITKKGQISQQILTQCVTCYRGMHGSFGS